MASTFYPFTRFFWNLSLSRLRSVAQGCKMPRGVAGRSDTIPAEMLVAPGGLAQPVDRGLTLGLAGVPHCDSKFIAAPAAPADLRLDMPRSTG